jgi:hypothetical protein
VAVGESGQLRQLGGGGGTGFVNEHGGTDSQVVDGVGWLMGVLMFGEQLVQSVGRNTGLGRQHFGCLSGSPPWLAGQEPD